MATFRQPHPTRRDQQRIGERHIAATGRAGPFIKRDEAVFFTTIFDFIKIYAVVDSIGQRNSYVKTWGCGGFLNETNIYSRGKSLCF